jgi:hypothetical protein
MDPSSLSIRIQVALTLLSSCRYLTEYMQQKKEKGYNRDREERHEEEGGYSA